MNKARTYTSPVIARVMKRIPTEKFLQAEKRMQLAVKIADTLEIKGWSKKDLADRMHKNPSEVSRWLSGSHNFTIDTLCSIEEVLNVQLVIIQSEKELAGVA